MHLLESFTVLYEASGQHIHRRKLQELLELIDARMIDHEHGSGLNQFDIRWNSVPALSLKRTWNAERFGERPAEPTQTTSYGHNTELVWLDQDAASDVRDGADGTCYVKRFNVTAVTHDREYDLTTGAAGSRVLYFTANPNGEAEVVKVTLRSNPKIKKQIFDYDFGALAVKGRQSRGNLLTRNEVYRITLKAHGGSTLGGRKVWFDHDVHRLNYDERGQYLGEFFSGDLVLVVMQSGEFFTTSFDVNNHYDPDILRIEKFSEHTVWTAVLFDADQQGFPYVKRFTFERTPAGRRLSFLGDNPASRFVLLTAEPYPRLKVTYGGADAFRDALEVDVESFIGVKSYKAKGKRLTTLAVERIEELEPLRRPDAPDAADPDSGTPVPDAADDAPDDVCRLGGGQVPCLGVDHEHLGPLRALGGKRRVRHHAGARAAARQLDARVQRAGEVIRNDQ